MPRLVQFRARVAGVDVVGREAVDGFGRVSGRAGCRCCGVFQLVFGKCRAFWTGGGFTVGEARTDVGSFEVCFGDLGEDGCVCGDQKDVEENGPSRRVPSRVGS